MASPDRKIAAVQPSGDASGVHEISSRAGNESEIMEAKKMTSKAATTENASERAVAAAADAARPNGNVR